MTDDEPLDLAAVAADEDAVESLRLGGQARDPALALLRDLLHDVDVDVEPPQPVPVGTGSTILSVAGEEGSARRVARHGTLVAGLTAGLLSLGGVAAASTLVPAGNPLHGLGEAVRSAAGAVVGAVTPPEPARASPVAGPTATATPAAAPGAAGQPRPPAPGATVSAATRSAAAAGQVRRLLGAAEALLDDGRTKAATERLDLAQRRLVEVLPADRGDLQNRLTALRERAAAATAPAPRPAQKPVQRPAQKPVRPAPAEQDARDEPPGKGPADREQPDREQSDEAEESDGDGRGGSPRSGSRSAPPKGGGGDASLPGQLSSDASQKPRA